MYLNVYIYIDIVTPSIVSLTHTYACMHTRIGPAMCVRALSLFLCVFKSFDTMSHSFARAFFVSNIGEFNVWCVRHAIYSIFQTHVRSESKKQKKKKWWVELRLHITARIYPFHFYWVFKRAFVNRERMHG